MKRIVIRTTSNMSYAGNICSSSKYQATGVAIHPNKSLKMEIFVPDEEIRELIIDGRIVSYCEYEQEIGDQYEAKGCTQESGLTKCAG